MTPPDMDEKVRDCIDNPVKSRTHEWADHEEAEYNNLKWRGRSLYDNLRTKYDVEHTTAYVWACDIFGRKNSGR